MVIAFQEKYARISFANTQEDLLLQIPPREFTCLKNLL